MATMNCKISSARFTGSIKRLLAFLNRLDGSKPLMTAVSRKRTLQGYFYSKRDLETRALAIGTMARTQLSAKLFHK